MTAVRFGLLTAVLLSTGCGEEPRPVPAKLLSSQYGAVCTVNIIADLSHGDSCEQMRSMLSPLGTCALRQVLAADSQKLLQDRLSGYGPAEGASLQDIWHWHQQVGTVPLPGSIVQSLETPKKSSCRSAKSWNSVKKQGTGITLRDLIPEFSGSAHGGVPELLYVRWGGGSYYIGPRTFSRPVYIVMYWQVDGPMSLTEAEQITRSLLSRLDLLAYDVSINISNHPWFLDDDGFPLRNPLIYNGTIPYSQVKTGAIGCMVSRGSVSCRGPFNQPNTGLDGQ